MTDRKLEICCGDIDSVAAAVAGGADRVELCSALAEGGVTPSEGLIGKALEMRGKAGVHVLIRPRGGDFLYDSQEADIMVRDVLTARRLGAQGIVIGALKTDGSIDTELCRRLISEAEDMSVTFHRAFDLCASPMESLEQIIGLGCDRILTSGLAPSAELGAEMLKRLNEKAAGRIIILAGGGVSPANAERILELSGVSELHASARSAIKSPMTYRNAGVAMGRPDSDEYSRLVTDKTIVRQLSDIIHNPSHHE